VPLPGLLLIRVTAEDKNPQYGLYAVKKRPPTLNEPLFHAPLPNVFSSGNICWGTVPKVDADARRGSSLAVVSRLNETARTVQARWGCHQRENRHFQKF